MKTYKEFKKEFQLDENASSITNFNDRQKYNALRKMEQDRISQSKKTSNPIKKSHHLDMANKHNDDANDILDKYKLNKEETELAELSTELLTNYKKKAGESASAADKAGDFKKGNKRFAGIIKATNKQFKNDIKEEVELDEVLDTHKGIQSYIKKSAEKRAELVKNDSITKPDHAEVRRKLEKSNKGFDKAIDKQYKLNKEEVDLDESERAEKKKSLVDMLNRMSKKAEENTKLQKNRDLKKPILSKEEFELQEARAKKEPMQLYHPTYSSAVQHARSQVEKQGYTIHDDDWHDHISMGPKRPSEGKTNQLHIPLHKDGQPTKKVAHIQVYNRGNDIKNNHELNMYVS